MVIVPINSRLSRGNAQEFSGCGYFDSEHLGAADLDRGALRSALLTDRANWVRLAMDEGRWDECCQALADELSEVLRAHVGPTARVALYHAFKNELDVSRLADAWCAAGGEVLLPVVQHKHAPLGFAPYRGAEYLAAGAYGIMEPVGGEVLQGPEGIDAVVIPCVGFNQEGYRLGYGGGYYDRTLARWQTQAESVPVLLGVALKQACVPLVPMAHDVPMDAVVCVI